MSDHAASHNTIALLGASNLTRGISVVVESLRLQHGSPLRIVAALGHGRSYGMQSSLLGRSLCSILDCGMWRALQDDPPRFALLTDVGNDIMYGALPSAIAGWISECIARLELLGVQRINLTALPLESIRAVPRWQFEIVRAVLFPSHDISYESAMAGAFETQALIEEVAARRPRLVRRVHHDRSWYGFDPIHIRHSRKASAWSRFLWAGEDSEVERPGSSFKRWLRLRRHMPSEYAIFGAHRRCEQPLRLSDGICVEMY